jgi:hypothetical protein
MLERNLFDAFAQSYEPPSWIIEDLLKGGPDAVRTALASSIEAVHLRRSAICLSDSVSVRLDPLLHGPADQLRGRFYRMDVYGRPMSGPLFVYHANCSRSVLACYLYRQ